MGLKLAEFRTGIREIERALAPETQRRALAEFAKGEVQRVIASGAGSASYRRYVNGREGVAEESVKLPGPIVYVFVPLTEAVEFALAYLKTRYPVRGPGRRGHFAESWKVLVDGKDWPGGDIPPSSEAVIVNTQPYARKVHVGARGFEAGRGLMEDARQVVLRKWRLPLDAQVRFIQLAGGYVLKGKGGDASQWAGWAGRASRNNGGRGARSGNRGRRDLIAGTPMKYPALVLSQRQN